MSGDLPKTLSSANATYTPNANYNGADSYTFKVNDGTVDSTLAATVSITISSVNDPPLANAQSVTTDEDTAKEITVVGDTGELNSITYTIVDNPTNGAVSLTDNKATYAPSAGYFGSDSFTFKVNDGTIDSEKATISITLTSNDLDEDGVLNDKDKCPDTPAGSIVDFDGCTVFNLPVNNNKVSVISASCIGTTDGSIGLKY